MVDGQTGDPGDLQIVVRHPHLDCAVVIEQDAKVAYAYLTDAGHIVGDVWLYNRGEAPREPEWSDMARLPFANARAFTADGDVPEVRFPTDITCTWTEVAPGAVQADISIGGEWFARLRTGSKPGWSKLAQRDGPLARRLDPLHDTE